MRLPSCAKCNEHEKRDREWVAFLTEKCAGDAAALMERQGLIIAWQERQMPHYVPISEEEKRAFAEECERVAAAIDHAHQRLRSLRVGRS